MNSYRVIGRPTVRCSASSAGFARATRSGGMFERGAQPPFEFIRGKPQRARVVRTPFYPSKVKKA